MLWLINNGCLISRSAFFAIKGNILTDVRKQIGDLDRAATVELGKVYRIPEGLRGAVVRKEWRPKGYWGWFNGY